MYICLRTQDLCQHTPEDHTDYQILRQSLKAMSDFIASTNDPSSFREVMCSPCTTTHPYIKGSITNIH